MYKVGDKIIFLEDFRDSQFGYKKGEIVTLTAYYANGSVMIPLRGKTNEDGWELSFKDNKYKLYKPIIKNDIEWLDQVQQNFKEGV